MKKLVLLLNLGSFAEHSKYCYTCPSQSWNTISRDSNLLLLDFDEFLVPGGVDGGAVLETFRTVGCQDVEAFSENLKVKLRSKL